MARLAGSFDSISHDVNQPLSQVIQTRQGTIFAATPAAILQPRTAIAWQIAPQTVLRTGFGLFSDILPGSVVDTVGTNPPYSKTFQGGLLGTVGGTAIAPGVPNSAIDATSAANRQFNSGFAQGELSCASGLANPSSCLPPISITAVPDGKLHAPYFMQWSLALEHQVDNALNLRAQYVGTRAVNQPYETQGNGYQTVCEGCFAPFPYAKPSDPRFGPVTQLNTGANSHYNGLQLTAEKRLGHGFQIQANYTWSRCMDTVSNGGFLPFAAGAVLSPLPGELGRQYGPCDYDVRQNFTAQYVYQLPINFRNRVLAGALNGWQVSGTAFWHSGLPFSVLSAAYSANGNGIVQGSGPQYASVVPGVPMYEHNPIPGVTQPGTVQWLNPNAFVSVVDPGTGACAGGDSPKNCQFGNLGRNALRGPDFIWSDLYLTKWFQLSEKLKLRIDGQFFNVFNHPNFGSAGLGVCRHSGQAVDTDRIRSAELPDFASDRTIGRRAGRGQLASDDRFSGPTGVLKSSREKALPARPLWDQLWRVAPCAPGFLSWRFPSHQRRICSANFPLLHSRTFSPGRHPRCATQRGQLRQRTPGLRGARRSLLAAESPRPHRGGGAGAISLRSLSRAHVFRFAE